MTDKQYYKQEIQPEIEKLQEKCDERGISFLAYTEYEDEDKSEGVTDEYMLAQEESPSFAFLLVRMAASVWGNVDLLIGRLLSYAEDHGNESVYLRQLQREHDRT